MHSEKDTAIVLVAYGSAHAKAVATYASIANRYQKEFSGSEVVLAFTSALMRRKAAEAMGTSIPSPLSALANLKDRGCEDAIVQSLHVVPGGEFHEMASLVSGISHIRGRFGFKHLVVGMPLLASLDDCKKVSSALGPMLDWISTDGISTDCRTTGLQRDPKEEAVVLVGHGSAHPGESLYCQMDSVLKQSHENVFLGTLEGYPGLDEVTMQLMESQVRRATLVPLLLVAGGHVFRDLAGDDENSWRRIIEGRGIQTGVRPQGLGECEEIVGILIEHTRDALDRMSGRLG